MGNDDKLYDVMIVIKPKNATISVVDNKQTSIENDSGSITLKDTSPSVHLRKNLQESGSSVPFSASKSKQNKVTGIGLQNQSSQQ